ncbi:HD-GYP domain-containing protein [Peribacillus kribbensis]|uniref:HD-GYP domain-containing protein n=1 Tax=Peribacillus kribbensis TaxID=356658 RepID=UPI00041D851E|nr:HD-GYP domain-containing protein [Peribacillus kribbensis]
MRVKIDELEPGCILAADVFGKTSRPIMGNKTVLSDQRIQVLKGFLIKEVNIERLKIDGSLFKPGERLDHEEFHEVQMDSPFIQQYLNAVQNYKKLFKSWQSGTVLDAGKVRELFLPLLERFLTMSYEVFNLHHYSSKEDYIHHHAIASGLISGYIAKGLKFSSGEIAQAALAGCLSDCGMSKVPVSILEKSSSLTAAEFEEIRNHPTYGYKMVQHNNLLSEGVKLAIIQHHERLDGSGYPLHSKENRLHPYSKIAALADMYHAMTSERVYRKKESPFKVLEMIKQDCFGEFDFAALKTLLDGIEKHLTGNRVKLSNGETAEVIFIEHHSPTRPLVKVLQTEEIMDLSKRSELFIEEVML